jgi:hypothetical protein
VAIGFSQTFALDRPLLAASLQALAERPGLDDLELAASIGVGGRKGMGFSGWLLYTGLRSSKPKDVSSLGRLLLGADRHLEDAGTQMVLHYRLASNRAASVWHLLVNEAVPGASTVDRGQATDLCLSQGMGRQGATNKNLVSDIGIFFNAYTDARALGRIGYLHRADDGHFLHGDIGQQVAPLIIGYVLYAIREAGPSVTTAGIGGLLSSEDHVGRLFLLDRPTLFRKLRELETHGLVKVSQEGGLDNVTYTYDGHSLDILGGYYRSNK